MGQAIERAEKRARAQAAGQRAAPSSDRGEAVGLLALADAIDQANQTAQIDPDADLEGVNNDADVVAMAEFEAEGGPQLP